MTSTKLAAVDQMAGGGPGQQIWVLLIGAVFFSHKALSLRKAKALCSEKLVRPLNALPGGELGQKAFTC